MKCVILVKNKKINIIILFYKIFHNFLKLFNNNFHYIIILFSILI